MPELRQGGAGATALSEAQRLDVLETYRPERLVDDPELDAITAFASKLCEAPIALVSLVHEDDQRFLSREGLNVCSTERSASFCQFAMGAGDIMEVRNAVEDPRFAANRLVTGAPHIRFYAGAPLLTDEGVPLGALCVISPEPRPDGLSAFQRDGLKVLAQAVMRRLEDRLNFYALESSEQRFTALADAIPQMAWSTPPDGQTDYFNARWYEFTGAKPPEHFGSGWIEALHPDDRDLAARVWSEAVTSGEPYEVEYRLKRADGEYRWTLARGLPLRDEHGKVSRWFGTNTDIHERRMMLDARDVMSRELSHRIKNIFSVIAGLIRLETRGKPELAPVANLLTDRIGALGRAHDFVRPQGPEDTPKTLQGVLRELFAPYSNEAGCRVQVDGEDLPLGQESVTPIALLFHELATNAAKYGALSVDGGVVKLNVVRDGEELLFDWSEQGGPTVSAPESMTGFGSQLVDMSVKRQLRGAFEPEWAEDGLRMRIRVPAKALH